MNLNELKRNESKLRRRLGDDQYEKIYTAQQRIEALRGKAANKRQGAGGDTDNMFYTNRPDSGTITNIPSIADYRKGIEDISAKIESLNKQQYEHMLSGDDNKVNALDNVIKNAEKQRDALRKQMTEAMGLGDESKEKDMLRARGNAGGSLFGAGSNKKAIGLKDEDEEYPSEPSPSPVPPPPPVEKDDPDMKAYEALLNDYDNAHDAWAKEVAQINSARRLKDPDYINNPRYISADDYFSKMYILNQNKGDSDYNKKKEAITERRNWSKDQEKYFDPPQAFDDYVKREDYKDDDDYYKDLAEHAIVYLDNGDIKGFEEFLKENKAKDDINAPYYIKKLREEKSIQHTISPGSPDLKPLIGDLEDYGNYWGKPPADKDYGRVYVKGKGIDIIPWSSENSEYPHEVVESYHLQKNDFNLGKYILNQDLEADGPNWFHLLQMAGQALGAIDWVDVDVDIIKIDGQKKAIIKYNDSAWANMPKKAGESWTDLKNGTCITLNKKHKGPEFGYMYAKGGKTWLKPLVYPGEIYIKTGEDVTYQLKKPVEVPKELVKKINNMFAEQGLGIELPY